MRISYLAVLAAFSFAFTATPTFAGVVFEVETTYHSGRPHTESSEIRAEGCNLKMEIPPGSTGSNNGRRTNAGPQSISSSGAAGEAVTVDSGAIAGYGTGGEPKPKNDAAIYKCANGGSLVFVDHNNRTYSPMPDRPVGVTVDPIKEALKGMTPEQRALMEGILGDALKGQQKNKPKTEIRVVNTGRKVRKNGYNTVVFERFKGGVLKDRMYGAIISDVDGGKTLMNAITAYGDFLEQRSGGMMGDDDTGTEIFELLAKQGYFPVVTESFEEGELDEEWTLRSAKRRTLDPAEFEPPSGYKRRSMFPQ